jgi:hypothetical protein
MNKWKISINGLVISSARTSSYEEGFVKALKPSTAIQRAMKQYSYNFEDVKKFEIKMELVK